MFVSSWFINEMVNQPQKGEKVAFLLTFEAVLRVTTTATASDAASQIISTKSTKEATSVGCKG
jgi:hypothetical protein